MSKYIDWDKITPRMKVKLVASKGIDPLTGKHNHHYEAGGKIVLIDGRNQRAIQSMLNARVKKDAQRFSKR